MSTEIIFFDIDDTLSRMGTLDKRSIAMLQSLRKNTDIKLAIATGRGSVMIPKDIQQLIDAQLIDAVICTNGQYNKVGNKLISHYPLNPSDAEAAAAICKKFALPYQQLSENHIAWSQKMPQFDMVTQNFKEACIISPNYYEKHTVYQFSVFLTEEEQSDHEEYSVAFQEIGFHFTRWQGGGADLLPDGCSKARGIDDICQHLNIPVENTMAFGDGLNDMEMLQHVDVGVAMGDGWEQLKSVADYVTGTIEENGINNALIHYGIL